jgi:hypothetical protein
MIVSELGENGYMLQQFNNPDNPKVGVHSYFLSLVLRDAAM